MAVILSNQFRFMYLYILVIIPCSSVVLNLKVLELNQNKHITVLNSFPGCSQNVINYRGLNIDFSRIFQPVILFHFLSFPKTWFLYPFEMSPFQNDKLSNWVLTADLTEIMATGKITVNNKTTWFTAVKALKYFRILQNVRFRLSLRKTHCEVNLHLHPPSKKFSSHLFFGDTLKNPFQLYHFGDSSLYWHIDYINTIPKYSILICNKALGSSCEDNQHKQNWISSALTHPLFVNFVEVIFIWENGSPLQIHCPYCNPCNPFETIAVQTKEHNFSSSLFQATEIIDKTYPKFVDIILSSPVSNYALLQKPEERTAKVLLNHISSMRMIFGIQLLSDIHQIAHLLPENITLSFNDEYNADWKQWKTLEMDNCQGTVNFPPKLRPLIHRSTRVHIALHQEIGFVFQRHQMQFVSCHKKQTHWIHQFKELVVAFDALTWMLLLLSFVTIAYIQSHTSGAFTGYRFNSVCHICFSLTSSLMEQSSIILQKPKIRSLVCALPLVFLILGNEYKGDNITRLTLEPSLVPFDTFESLLHNNFKIYSVPFVVPYESYRQIKQYLKSNESYVKQSAHEFYPIVSQLWYEVLKQFSFHDYKTLDLLLQSFSKTTQTYLNNSKIIPNWKNTTKPQSYNQTIYQVLDMHMESCNKSALIVSESLAIQLNTILKSLKRPVYFGKDVVNENLLGYSYYGYFPTNIMRRVKYSFQSGITEWWQNFFKFVIKLKSEKEGKSIIKSKKINLDTNSKAGIYILSMIPGVGLLLSVFWFIFMDSSVASFCFAYACERTSKFIKSDRSDNRVIKLQIIKNGSTFLKTETDKKCETYFGINTLSKKLWLRFFPK